MDTTQRYFEVEYRHTLGRDFRDEHCWHLLHDGETVERGGRRPRAGGVVLAVVAVLMIWVLLPATVQPLAEMANTPAVPVPELVSQAHPHWSLFVA